MPVEVRGALADREPPFAYVDVDALDHNAADLRHRAAGTPIRVASKSVRCRYVLDRVLAMPGFAGVLALTLPEALWLHGHGVRDVVVAYPWVGRSAIDQLATAVATDPDGAPVVMVDDVAHVELLAGAAKAEPISVCMDLDVGLQPFGDVHLGAKRSPIRSVAEAVQLARAIDSSPGVQLVGAMAYEAHVAGVADDVPGRFVENLVMAGMKRFARRDVATRRAEMVAAISEITELRFVNGGGTGSVESTAAEEVVTEVAAGSGLYGPQLFQYYRDFDLRPAAGYVLPVVRRPDDATATLLGGGYVASGPPRQDRQPVVVHPPGLELTGSEGAGEAQTPVVGPGAAALRIGDQVFLRHAKAGELCERFDRLHLVADGHLVDTVPTYRGEGRTFL